MPDALPRARLKTTKLKLNPGQQAQLRRLEAKLQDAVRAAQPARATEIAAEIQCLFGLDRRHHRLLRAKLWAFEAVLDANDLTYAENGLVGIRKLAGRQTRLFLEATILLGVCKLRQKDISEAKRLIKEVIGNINNVRSDRTRQQFQKRVIERVEEECILVEIVGRNEGQLIPQEIHDKAVLLIQRNSDDEIYALIGNAIPSSGVLLLKDVRDYSILQLPPPDRKLLPGPKEAEQPANVGKKTFAVLRRIAWKTFCHKDSEIFKLWSKRVPKVFNEGYFAAAVTTTFGQWRIGLPLLASGVVALVMKYSAEVFCELAQPKALMIDRKEKDAAEDGMK